MNVLFDGEDNSLRREYLLTAAGSQEINGTYTQNTDDGMFYNKRAAAGDPPGTLFIITLDSIKDKGEDFDVAWVLQSHDVQSHRVVSFYAAPCDDPESLGLPAKGWTTLSGLEPVPRVYARPKQQPRDRASTLDIIEEGKEREFSLEPFWPDEEETLPSEDDANRDQFDDWDEIREVLEQEYDGDGDMEEFDEFSSEGDSDYDLELPEDLMENFRDGQFGHKPKAENETTFSPDRQREVFYPRGSAVDSESSDDLSIIRHDTNEFDQETSEGRTSTSSQGDGDEKEEKPSIPVVQNVQGERRVQPVINTTLNHKLQPNSRSRGGAIAKPPSPSAPLYGCKILKMGSSEDLAIRQLVERVKDPFTPAHQRFRKSQDHQRDVDLISAFKETSEPRTNQRRFGRISGSKASKSSSSTKPDRNRGKRRVLPVNVEKPTNVGEVNTGEEIKLDTKISQTSADNRDEERLKLEHELHQLKTKMRKCDRLSKLRNRGRSLTKEQQETLVNKSKHQHRIEELRKLIGSNVGKS